MDKYKRSHDYAREPNNSKNKEDLLVNVQSI